MDKVDSNFKRKATKYLLAKLQLHHVWKKLWSDGTLVISLGQALKNVGQTFTLHLSLFESRYSLATSGPDPQNKQVYFESL